MHKFNIHATSGIEIQADAPKIHTTGKRCDFGQCGMQTQSFAVLRHTMWKRPQRIGPCESAIHHSNASKIEESSVIGQPVTLESQNELFQISQNCISNFAKKPNQSQFPSMTAPDCVISGADPESPGQTANPELLTGTTRELPDRSQRAGPITRVERPALGVHSAVVLFRALKAFLTRLFRYESVGLDDLCALSSPERGIMAHILKAKRYRNWRALTATLRLRSTDTKAWTGFAKRRRKEEHLKYSFKLVIKLLQRRFAQSHKHALAGLSPETGKLVFYLFYFCEHATGERFGDVLERLRARPDPNKHLKQYWKTVGDYILPEMGTQSSFSRVKSISKHFIERFARSARISGVFLGAVINTTLFLCSRPDRTGPYPPEARSELDDHGETVLRIIRGTNATEVEKLFAEWDNRLRGDAGRAVLADTCRASQVAEAVKRAVGRKNFKFPWTLREVQNSFVDALLSYLEVSRVDSLRASQSGKCKPNPRLDVQGLRGALPHGSQEA